MNKSGFVIANAGSTKYRTMNELGQIIWTPDIDKALHFARREDADTFAKEDEDAWSIREHVFGEQQPKPISLIKKASQLITRLQQLIENYKDQDIFIALQNPDGSYGPLGTITSIAPDADATTFFISYTEDEPRCTCGHLRSKHRNFSGVCAFRGDCGCLGFVERK